MNLLVGAIILGLAVWIAWSAWNNRTGWQASLVIGLFLLSVAINALLFSGRALGVGE